MTIYLYVKTHNKTNMKYLGMTQRDPFKYKGSGKYWRLHLNKYGNDVSTTIIGKYNNKEELKEAGTYYSNLWNVVESDEWANLIPENADGGKEPAKKGGSAHKGRKYVYHPVTHKTKRPKIELFDKYIQDGWLPGLGPLGTSMGKKGSLTRVKQQKEDNWSHCKSIASMSHKNSHKIPSSLS